MAVQAFTFTTSAVVLYYFFKDIVKELNVHLTFSFNWRLKI